MWTTSSTAAKSAPKRMATLRLNGLDTDTGAFAGDGLLFRPAR
jgi:hypothetical protein